MMEGPSDAVSPWAMPSEEAIEAEHRRRFEVIIGRAPRRGEPISLWAAIADRERLLVEIARLERELSSTRTWATCFGFFTLVSIPSAIAGLARLVSYLRNASH